MAGRTGYTPVGNTDAFGFDQINAGFAHFDGKIGESVTNVTDLPATGNFTGRRIYVTSTLTGHVWTGSVWRTIWWPQVLVGAVKTGTQNAGSAAAFSVITWDSDRYSSGLVVVGGSRVTFTRAGKYDVSGQTRVPTVTDAYAKFFLSGAAVDRTEAGQSNIGTIKCGSSIFTAAVGDYLELGVTHVASGNPAIQASASFLDVKYLGP